MHAAFCTEDVKPFPSLPSMILSVEEDKALVGPVTLAVQNQEGWWFQPVALLGWGGERQASEEDFGMIRCLQELNNLFSKYLL